MATALPRITGKDVVLTLIGSSQNINFESIDGEVNGTYSDCKSCGSAVMQRSFIHADSKFTLVAWAGAEFNMAAANLKQNAVVNTIAFTTNEGGTPSLLQDDFATLFPTAGWRVETVKYSQPDKDGKVTVTLVPNVIGGI